MTDKQKTFLILFYIFCVFNTAHEHDKYSFYSEMYFEVVCLFVCLFLISKSKMMLVDISLLQKQLAHLACVISLRQCKIK